MPSPPFIRAWPLLTKKPMVSSILSNGLSKGHTAQENTLATGSLSNVRDQACRASTWAQGGNPGFRARISFYLIYNGLFDIIDHSELTRALLDSVKISSDEFRIQNELPNGWVNLSID